MLEMPDRACCAHMKVFWQTKRLYSGLVRGWWECADCGLEFGPLNPLELYKLRRLEEVEKRFKNYISNAKLIVEDDHEHDDLRAFRLCRDLASEREITKAEL